MISKSVFLFLLAVQIFYVSRSQGCSDAGFCTIGNQSPGFQEKAGSSNHSLGFVSAMGVGDEGVMVISPALEYNFFLSSSWAFQAKITAGYASGNLGTATGPGDIFLAGNYYFNRDANWKTSATIGIKLPLNQSDLSKNELTYPMQYQSSLGTTDILLGFSMNNNRWMFSAGWQQPISGTNKNSFIASQWSDPDAINYPPSNQFNRKADLLFRSNYSFIKNSKMLLNGGILGIYHLENDRYLFESPVFSPAEIYGSKGLTLNLTTSLQLELSKKFNLGFSAGMPLIVREQRPDGLTRKFVLAPELSFRF